MVLSGGHRLFQEVSYGPKSGSEALRSGSSLGFLHLCVVLTNLNQRSICKVIGVCGPFLCGFDVSAGLDLTVEV